MAKTKVALIGASGLAAETEAYQLYSFAWNRLEALPNLRDFEIIIINLLEGVPHDDVTIWTPFCDQLHESSTQEILNHGGRIYVLGDPRFLITRVLKPHSQDTTNHQFLKWTGFEFYWDPASGTHIEISSVDAKLVEYLRHLKHWNYSLLAARFNNAQVAVEDLAHNRTQQALAAALGPGHRLFLLPPISLSGEDTVLLALRLFAGIDAAPASEPEWVAALTAPGQQEIDQQIAEVDRQLDDLQTQRAALVGARETARSVLKVLYERGPALENAVRALLATLGCTVTEPVEGNKEDGWIQFGPDEGVIEVKSTGGATFGEDGIRQLLEWIQRGESSGKSYKGIFIGLNNAGQPPGTGGSPFSASFVRSATRFEMVAILTHDLYRAYELMQADKLTPQEFWPTVFATNGIYSSEWLETKEE